MRDVISNETIKEINEVIDEILTNIDDNVRNIVGAGNYSLPTIFSYTNYSGQTINVHGSTFRHEIIIDNADGNNLIGDICTVIGDRNGIKLAKAGVEDRHDTFANYWDSTFDIAYDSDTTINGYVFDMQSGFVGEGTGQSKVMSFKFDNLEVGRAYTLTFRGKFVNAQFVSGQESLVRICSTTAETPYLAQVTLEKDTDAHIYRIDFTNNTQGTTLYLNFWFYGVADDTETYRPEFIADDLIIAGMNIGIISRYIDYNGKWYPIEAGGGTSDLDAIELTYAEYQALSAAEKTDPDKIYFITDYPTSGGSLEDLSDVDIDDETLSDGQILTYDETADKWVNEDAPTPPTVGNGTITIQKNGTDVDNFTTNQSSNKTINITMSKGDVGLGNVPNVTTDNQEPTVTEASTRANIATGDTLKTIIGKIKKFFSDLKAVAFSGSYNDLSDQPTIPSAVAVKGNNESTYRTGNVNLTNENIGSTPYKGNLRTEIGDATPAAATKTYWTDNIAPYEVSTAYDNKGDEYTILFSKGGDNNYGNILKWGYADKYLRILRKNSNGWLDSDWAKIDAGYADTAGSAPASDVSAWAKASTKPSYTHDEIGEGFIKVGDGANYQLFRTTNTWRAGMYYHTIGDEAMVFANQNTRASWIFANTDPEARASWTGLSPAMHIKNGKVAIGKLIANSSYLTYPLEVNGDVQATNFRGALIGNADTATQATQDGDGNTISSTYVKVRTTTDNANYNTALNISAYDATKPIFGYVSVISKLSAGVNFYIPFSFMKDVVPAGTHNIMAVQGAFRFLFEFTDSPRSIKLVQAVDANGNDATTNNTIKFYLYRNY